MDVMVLEAQKWVNATYIGVTGYVKCPEDGKTAWSVMYSLTRALQHELGITALSDAFGPTTLGTLQARGGSSSTRANKNIIKIIQCGCFCKGYNAGAIDGIFTLNTQFAVTAMQDNAGLGNALNGVVQPKVFKALLSMDAYIVVQGGTESVRSIQRWINGRYVSRRDFYIIPCDGNFSRDVQKALLMAIQFEIGMTDDQATGAFGPGTQAGLRANPISTSSSGVWVNLFTAAMVFNGYGSFADSFSAELSNQLKEFQTFSALPASGGGDFATWAQLLVSTGDPNRPGTASDGITTIDAARAKTLYDNGYRYIGRYLDERGGTLDKEIKPGELAAIFAGGLRVFPISQYYGGERSYFTYSQGFQDALGAHAAAVTNGFNKGTVIYFAVDYDATQDEIDGNIIPYFYGVVGGLAAQGKRYVHGVYGSRNVCAEVTRQTYARWSFVSGMSTGFSGNMGFPLPENWAFNQIQTLTLGSGAGLIEIDKNIHRSGSDAAVGAVNTPGSSVDNYVEYIQRLYDAAVEYGKGDPNLRVLEFLRFGDYSDSRWQILIGDLDVGFINFVNDKGIARVTEFVDPFYGVNVGVSHFGASANGLLLKNHAGGVAVNRSDFTGWGGDWISFYGEWRRDSDSYASGYVYCQEKLAKVSDVGTFKMNDLIEDADAFNIVSTLLSSGGSIADLIRSNLQGTGYLSRMKRFYEGRFHNGTDATAIAKNMLLPGDDVIMNTARTALIEQVGGYSVALPIYLPGGVLDDFVSGLPAMLLSLVGAENARANRLRAEGKVS